MNFPLDYHIHTHLSDGRSDHSEYIEAAREKGVAEIGFSDHLCLKEVKWGRGPSLIPEMTKRFAELKKKSDVTVKLGLEVDYFPGYEDRIKELINKIPLDYAIGSVHFIKEWNFENLGCLGEYDKWDMDDLYKEYFQLIQQAARSKLFDIIGHPDVVKKFNFKPKREITDLLEETAKVFKDNGVCIEINTGGLSKPCKEFYPSNEFLKICFNNGVPITFGSDAHEPQDIARHFDEAIKLVRETGYKKIIQFTQRKKNPIDV